MSSKAWQFCYYFQVVGGNADLGYWVFAHSEELEVLKQFPLLLHLQKKTKYKNILTGIQLFQQIQESESFCKYSFLEGQYWEKVKNQWGCDRFTVTDNSKVEGK